MSEPRGPGGLMNALFSIPALDGLIGRDVVGVKVGDTDVLLFEFADGSHAGFVAYGDCCSSSWFEHVDALDFRGVVTKVDNNSPPREGLPADYVAEAEKADSESLLIDFMTVFTERGRLQIEMRNSSNGYYSGYVRAATPQAIAGVTTWRDVN